MIDYYYIDMYFNADRTPMKQAAAACLDALMEAGCRFNKVTMARPDTRQHITLGEHVALTPADLPAVAHEFIEDALKDDQNFIAFPPLGRVMLNYDFRLDTHLLDEIQEEEEDMNSKSNDLGLTFMYSAGKDVRIIKATLSFWEEYVLKLGDPELQVQNMRDIVNIIRNIWSKGDAVFGAMNTEMHLNTDSALALLRQGKLPEGNEFTMIGADLLDRLDIGQLKAKGYSFADLPGGGMIIQMADKWEGRQAI